MANYYGSRLFRDADNNIIQTAPILPKGVVGCISDNDTANTLYTSSDNLFLARLPGGHVPVRLEIMVVGDPDSGGASLAGNVGTTADADLIAAAYSFTVANQTHIFPQGDADGITYGSGVLNTAFFTTAAPTSAYNVLIDFSGSATTSSTATWYWRLYYTNETILLDPQASPAAVAGTQ